LPRSSSSWRSAGAPPWQLDRGRRRTRPISKAILATPAECTNRRADSEPQLEAWAGNVLWSDPDLARDRRFADSPLEEGGFELLVPSDTVSDSLIWPLLISRQPEIVGANVNGTGVDPGRLRGTGSSNPARSSRESPANLDLPDRGEPFSSASANSEAVPNLGWRGNQKDP
jgi:hypothetical protein